MSLHNLNKANGADKVILSYAQRCMREFPADELTGVEMGIAYGGGIEQVSNLWQDRGHVWGFDTFEDLHPVHLAKDKDSFQAKCMDHWYKLHGTEKLRYEYISNYFKGNFRVHLVKGEVHKDSCEKLDKIHYALLDMDIIKSVENGWLAVKDKIVKEGYVLFHDALPDKHMPDIYNLVYNMVLKDKRKWRLFGEYAFCHLTVIQRR